MNNKEIRQAIQEEVRAAAKQLIFETKLLERLQREIKEDLDRSAEGLDLDERRDPIAGEKNVKITIPFSKWLKFYKGEHRNENLKNRAAKAVMDALKTQDREQGIQSLAWHLKIIDRDHPELKIGSVSETSVSGFWDILTKDAEKYQV